MSDISEKPPEKSALFLWKHEVRRALIAAAATPAVTLIMNVVYRVRFLELGGFIESLPIPLLIFVTGVFVVFSFVLRIARLEQRIIRIISNCMLVAGLAGLSLAVVAALNIGAVPLGSFELTADNIYDDREVPVPKALERVTLKVSGDKDPGFLLELERHPAGSGIAEKLAIEGLELDNAIKHSRYYTLVRGEFTVPGAFKAGDTLYINIVNASSFEGKIKLELTGSKN